MSRAKFTILQLGDANGVDRDNAYHLVCLLRAKGLIEKTGVTPGAGKRGQDLFEGDQEKIATFLREIKIPTAEATAAAPTE